MEVPHNSRERKIKRPRENTRAIRNTLVKLFTHEMESAICYTSLGCSMLFYCQHKRSLTQDNGRVYVFKIYAKFVLGKAMVRPI
jgi:hypothetical protein